MAWNWTLDNWPEFAFDPAPLAPLERQFLVASGEMLGAFHHVGEDEQSHLRIELLSEEAVKTSQIEGEALDRFSVQSSLRRQLGLATDAPASRPQESGIAEMMLDIYASSAAPLDNETLFRWHTMMMSGNRHLDVVGGYRQHHDAMQIISGRVDKPVIHFEAPPSVRVPSEMEAYIGWFNSTAPNGNNPLSALTRAGIGHLYFESIHPFEDGNGRLGRALAEKSLAQNVGRPSLILLAHTIERNRRAYYDQLAAHQTKLEITGWLIYFAQTVLDAQQATIERVAFHIAKTGFYDRHRDRLNDRQAKVIGRMFREGPDGFTGGLSAENYISITQTSRATATRDLQDLVQIGALTRSGTLRHTRYALNMPGWKKDQ